MKVQEVLSSFLEIVSLRTLPNLHSAYLGDSGPLEGLCAEAVLAFCSCLPAFSAKLPLALAQQVAGGGVEGR